MSCEQVDTKLKWFMLSIDRENFFCWRLRIQDKMLFIFWPIVFLLYNQLNKCTAKKTGVTVEMLALGRPFNLGSIYDLSKHEMLGGGAFLLWNADTLKNITTKVVDQASTVKHTLSKDFKKKADLFNIEASILAKIMGNLFEIEGSVKYMLAEDSSHYENTITVGIQKQFYRKDVNDLNNIDYKYMFAKFPQATHIVTSITYGGEAALSFRKTFATRSEVQDIKAKLGIKILISGILGGGSVEIKIGKELNGTMQGFRCTFYGSANLDMVPTSMIEGIQLVNKLPKWLNERNAVPIKVVLTPIQLFQSEIDRIIMEIDKGLLERVEKHYEEYQEISLSLGDLFESLAYKTIKIVKNHVDHFKMAFNSHKGVFDAKLAILLPQLRGKHASTAKSKLDTAISRQGNYSLQSLSSWIEAKQDEMDALHLICKWNPTFFMYNSAQKQRNLWNPTNVHVFIFSMKIYYDVDLFTSCVQDNSLTGCKDTLDYTPWTDHALFLRSKFGEFIEATTKIIKWNKSVKDKFKFFISVDYLKKNGTASGAIEYYRHGDLVDNNVLFPRILAISAVFRPCNKTLYVKWRLDYNKTVIFPNNDYVVRYQHAYKNTTGKWKPLIDISYTNCEIQKHFEDQEIMIHILKKCIFEYCVEQKKKFLPQYGNCPNDQEAKECEYREGVEIEDEKTKIYDPFEGADVFATPYACCFGCAREENSIGFSYIVTTNSERNVGKCYCKYGRVIRIKKNGNATAGLVKPRTFPK